MALINHVLWAEDFTGYTDDRDLAAAYPDHTGVDGRQYDLYSSSWGATAGPDGQPGIADDDPDPEWLADFPGESSGFKDDTGTISRTDLAPTCYGFSAEARSDFSVPNQILTGHPFFGIHWVTADDANGPLFQVSRFHATAALTVTVRTISPYGNAGGGIYHTQTFNGTLPSGTPKTVKVYGRRSTMTETSPGVFAPEADGEVHVLVEGVEIYTFTGPVWGGRSDLNPTPYWNAAEFHTLGKFSGILVMDEIGCEAVSEPCECVEGPTVPPALPPPIPRNPPQTPPLIGMQLACVGGGVVPTQADLAYIENWWNL